MNGLYTFRLGRVSTGSAVFLFTSNISLNIYRLTWFNSLSTYHLPIA